MNRKYIPVVRGSLDDEHPLAFLQRQITWVLCEHRDENDRKEEWSERRTSLVYSYIASAHSPSGSGCGLGGGGGGGGDALDSLFGDDTADGTRLGGGAKLFLICGSAAGTGAATGGGVAVLFAVPWRIDRYMFFPEVKSTSPNFCRTGSESICHCEDNARAPSAGPGTPPKLGAGVRPAEVSLVGFHIALAAKPMTTLCEVEVEEGRQGTQGSRTLPLPRLPSLQRWRRLQTTPPRSMLQTTTRMRRTCAHR